MEKSTDRRIDTALKQPAMQKRLAAELFFVLMMVKQELLSKRLIDVVMRPTPVPVQEATKTFLHEFGNQIGDFIAERLETISDSTQASTEPQIQTAYLQFAQLDNNRTNKQEAQRKLLEVFSQIAGVGGRRCLRLKGSCSGFMKVKN